MLSPYVKGKGALSNASKRKTEKGHRYTHLIYIDWHEYNTINIFRYYNIRYRVIMLYKTN